MLGEGFTRPGPGHQDPTAADAEAFAVVGFGRAPPRDQARAGVCFIIDVYSRAIVRWRVASHMRTTMVLDAIEMARWSRGTQLDGLRRRSDAGSQFTSIRYGERLAEIGAVPSIGTVGDSYDCETVDSLRAA